MSCPPTRGPCQFKVGWSSSHEGEGSGRAAGRSCGRPQPHLHLRLTAAVGPRATPVPRLPHCPPHPSLRSLLQGPSRQKAGEKEKGPHGFHRVAPLPAARLGRGSSCPGAEGSGSLGTRGPWNQGTLPSTHQQETRQVEGPGHRVWAGSSPGEGRRVPQRCGGGGGGACRWKAEGLQ